MAIGVTDFPTALDSNAVADNTTEITSGLFNSHSVQIEALETKVGIDESEDTDSLDYKVAHSVTMAEVFAAMYPVGSIYTNASVATNPATLLGFGTWAAFGAGRVIVGFDATDTDFDTAEETGGSKTMAHTHTTTDHSHTTTDHSHTTADHSHGYSGTTGNPSADQYSYSGSDATAEYFCSRRYHTHGFSGNTGGASAGNTTSGASAGNTTSGASNGNTTSAASNANNLQPYITVYIWKRTA